MLFYRFTQVPCKIWMICFWEKSSLRETDRYNPWTQTSGSCSEAQIDPSRRKPCRQTSVTLSIRFASFRQTPPPAVFASYLSGSCAPDMRRYVQERPTGFPTM